MAQDLTATSVKLLWSPPEESHRNGIITVYGLCYQEASLETSCTTDVQVPGEKLSYDITKGLRPNTEYMFTVAAATVTGLGPRAVLYESTLSSGNFKIYAQSKWPQSCYGTTPLCDIVETYHPVIHKFII